ncbi:MAG: Gfo/Idh/MocA family oxidoreductase [Bacteroidales bacterium]|nr:Gfo/Idh/MocA family oxidoreductase [Bacteroidales bacterium]
MKRSIIIAVMCLLSLASCKSVKTITASVPAHEEDGVIVLETPAREPGQESALGMKCEPLDTVRIGFVGIGGRGTAAVQRYTYLDNVRVVALCDENPARVDACNEILANAGLPQAAGYVGSEAYKELCERDDIDLVYIATDWLDHVPVAVYAMNHGKHAAIEVPGAMTIEDCWAIVNTSEKTRRHCMMLENCCYDFFEMAALNMAQQGVFGEVYHVEGAYIHFLAEDWGFSEPWRIDYNMAHRGDNYPTHGLGPIAQVLDIHRGDKFDYLVSMDTPSYNGKVAAKRYRDSDECLDGDHTISLIRTEKGKVVEVQHNVYAYRPYTRMFQLTGTEGFANKYPIEQISVKGISGHREVSKEVMDSLLNAYKFDFVKEIEDKAREVGGHGGMDFIMDYRLVYCLHNGLPLDQDVYDAAEWSCVQELSRISLENGSKPVKVPDFTRGDWNVVKGFRYAFKD